MKTRGGSPTPISWRRPEVIVKRNRNYPISCQPGRKELRIKSVGEAEKKERAKKGHAVVAAAKLGYSYETGIGGKRLSERKRGHIHQDKVAGERPLRGGRALVAEWFLWKESGNPGRKGERGKTGERRRSTKDILRERETVICYKPETTITRV